VAKLRQIEADITALQQSIRAETALAQFPEAGSAKRPFDRAHVSSRCKGDGIHGMGPELAFNQYNRVFDGAATMLLWCSQVLPFIVGSSAPLSELVQQVVAAFKSADTGDSLDEVTVRAAILDMAVRKAHAGRTGTNAHRCRACCDGSGIHLQSWQTSRVGLHARLTNPGWLIGAHALASIWLFDAYLLGREP